MDRDHVIENGHRRHKEDDGLRLRTGRKVGRTIYAQLGPEPSDADPLIGVMDAVALARFVVDAVNSAATEGDVLVAYEQAVKERRLGFPS